MNFYQMRQWNATKKFPASSSEIFKNPEIEKKGKENKNTDCKRKWSKNILLIHINDMFLPPNFYYAALWSRDNLNL